MSNDSQVENLPLLPQLKELGELAVKQDTKTEEYRDLKNRAKKIVHAHPDAVATQLQFRLDNGIIPLEERYEMLTMLYELAGEDGYRWSAVKMAGQLAEGSTDPDFLKETEKSIKGVLRRTKGRGVKAASSADPTEERAREIVAGGTSTPGR